MFKRSEHKYDMVPVIYDYLETKCSWRWQTSPPCCRHLANWIKCFIFGSGPFAPLCENLVSFTKLELHQATGTCNIQKIWWSLDIWFLRYARGETDIDTLITVLCTTSGGKVITKIVLPTSFKTVLKI